MREVDARGCACPEPVVMTRNSILADASGAVVLVDNHAAVENVTRFAKNQGYSVQTEALGDDTRLTITKA